MGDGTSQATTGLVSLKCAVPKATRPESAVQVGAAPSSLGLIPSDAVRWTCLFASHRPDIRLASDPHLPVQSRARVAAQEKCLQEITPSSSQARDLTDGWHAQSRSNATSATETPLLGAKCCIRQSPKRRCFTQPPIRMEPRPPGTRPPGALGFATVLDGALGPAFDDVDEGSCTLPSVVYMCTYDVLHTPYSVHLP